MQTAFFRDFYAPAEEIRAAQVDWQNFPEHQEIIRIAELALEQRFVFDLADDLIKTWEPVQFVAEIDWSFQPGDDPEFVWQLNRHRFLLCLAQAYVMTQEEKYAHGFRRLAEDFMEKEPEYAGRENTTWRILELGIRSENWIKGLYLLQDAPQIKPDFLARAAKFLEKHATVIIQQASAYNFAGNWGVLENHGVFLLGALLPPNEETLNYLSHAEKTLQNAAQIQVMDDGMQLEQSPMYHNEVLRCFLEVIYFSRLLERPVDPSFVEIVRKMAIASRYSIKPNGKTFAGGDSDETSIIPILELAALVFNDATLRFSTQLNFSNLWLLQTADQKYLSQLGAIDPPTTTAYFPDSGQSYFRSSWEKNADLLHFNAGNLGVSHGHSDLLHLDWIVNGTDVLIDPGRYTYVDKQERYQMKNLTAHNSIVIDELEPYQWQGSWQSGNSFEQFRRPIKESGAFAYTEAAHTGYLQLAEPVLATRRILRLAPTLFVVIDLYYGNGSHQFQQFWHFDIQGKVTLQDRQAGFTNKTTTATVLLDEKLTCTLTETEQSYAYNQKTTNQTVVGQLNAQGTQTLITILAAGDGQDLVIQRGPVKSYRQQTDLPTELVEGLKITTATNEYVVIIAKGEAPGPIDLYDFAGCHGCGKMIVFEPNKNPVGGTVLGW